MANIKASGYGLAFIFAKEHPDGDMRLESSRILVTS